MEVSTKNIEAYIYHKPKSGNLDSGDTYFTHSEENYFVFAIADGLGNGPVARESSEIIPKTLAQYHHEPIDDLMIRCNNQMLQKRGAAVAIVKVDFEERTIQYSCVGNVRLYIWQNAEKMVYPLPVRGYLSGRPIKLNPQTYPYYPGDLFLLHSDGIELRSPTSLLKNTTCLFDLYHTIMTTSLVNDDTTFIIGNLLR